MTVPSSDYPQQVASSSCNSLNGSPSTDLKTLPPAVGSNQSQYPPTHDRMGSYKYIQLPAGTVTKRRSANPATVKSEVKINRVYSFSSISNYPLTYIIR